MLVLCSGAIFSSINSPYYESIYHAALCMSVIYLFILHLKIQPKFNKLLWSAIASCRSVFSAVIVANIDTGDVAIDARVQQQRGYMLLGSGDALIDKTKNVKPSRWQTPPSQCRSVTTNPAMATFMTASSSQYGPFGRVFSASEFLQALPAADVDVVATVDAFAVSKVSTTLGNLGGWLSWRVGTEPAYARGNVDSRHCRRRQFRRK